MRYSCTFINLLLASKGALGQKLKKNQPQMALACMLWRSSVRTTSPVSAALRTLMRNTPLWSTEPVWHGQSGPVAPSWHHPQERERKKQTLQVSGKVSALIWPRFASDWGVRVVHASRQNHQKRRVHQILLWSFGTLASITFDDSEESDSACLEATLRIFLSFCMLWLNWRIFFFFKSTSPLLHTSFTLLWCLELARPRRRPTHQRPVSHCRGGCGSPSLEAFRKLVRA